MPASRPLGESAGVRPGQVVHPALHVRLAQPARDVRPQARCAGGDPRRVRCIPSSVPGLNVCDRLPRLSQVMDKVSLIRSVSHPYPIHGVAFATTGIPKIDVALEINPQDPSHWPFIGSAVDYIDGRRTDQSGRPRSPLPRNLVLPWAFSSQRVGEVPRVGAVWRVPRPGV